VTVLLVVGRSIRQENRKAELANIVMMQTALAMDLSSLDSSGLAAIRSAPSRFAGTLEDQARLLFLIDYIKSHRKWGIVDKILFI
jgi:hypothetical protein